MSKTSRRALAAVLSGFLLPTAGSATAEAAEAPTEVRVVPAPTSSAAPLINAGVTLSTGVLRHAVVAGSPDEATDYRLYSQQVGPGADGTGSPVVADVPLVNPVPCETGATCVRLVDGANQGPAYLGRDGSRTVLRSTDTTQRILEVPAAAKVLDASPRYRLLQYPGGLTYFTTVGGVGVPGPAAGALWFDTLWRAQEGASLLPWHVPTETQSGPALATGSTCTPTEVQATGKHLFWSCGPQGPAGVVEIATRRTIAVPAGQYLLGDNYLVRHDASGALLRYDVTTGTLGEPVTLATFPRGDLADDRNITWAVDKFGGDVAWVDAGNAVHIVDPGVRASAPVAVSTSAPAVFEYQGDPFTVRAELTRPVDNTTLIITQVRTGQSIQRIGSAARVTSTTTWDGLMSGARAQKGKYRWALAASVDGVSTTLAAGYFSVACGGRPVLHGYDCSGQPTLLALNSAADGTGVWQSARYAPDGTITMAHVNYDGLRALNGVLPFGDLNQDNANDLLVRRSDGSLYVYQGGVPFGGGTPALISGGWNVYDALVHTGDLTGDGRSDLVARDRASGALYLFRGNGTGGFQARTKIEGGYKGYSRFVGTGDINGDGKADLMLQYDPTSTMYALYGNDDGTFQSGLAVVGTGWLGYNAVIGAGDLNEDGRNDLLLRDTAGNLYRRLGTGAGTFGDRQLVGTGYQQYAGLY